MLNWDYGRGLLATRTLGEAGAFSSLRTQQLVFRAQPGGAFQEDRPDVVLNLRGVSEPSC